MHGANQEKLKVCFSTPTRLDVAANSTLMITPHKNIKISLPTATKKYINPQQQQLCVATDLLEEIFTPRPAFARRSSVLVAKDGSSTTRGPMESGTPANSTSSGSPTSHPAACGREKFVRGEGIRTSAAPDFLPLDVCLFHAGI